MKNEVLLNPWSLDAKSLLSILTKEKGACCEENCYT